MASTEPNAILGERIDYGNKLSIFRVVPKGWKVPDFKPGQYATLSLPGTHARVSYAEPEKKPPADPTKLVRRAYSIASSPFEKDYFEFNITMVPFGSFTPRLWNLKVGDELHVTDRIIGEFTMEHVPEDKNVVFIGTGTGLAPYISMTHAFFKPEMKRHFAVFHGVRTSQDLAYRAELKSLDHYNSNFQYFPIISRPKDDPVPWNTHSGHVQVLWDEKVLKAAWGFEPTPENTHVFLCGSPGMIDGMLEKLTQAGFKEHSRKEPHGQIHVEKYWQS